MELSNDYYNNNPDAYEAHKEKMRVASRKRYQENKKKLELLKQLQEQAEVKHEA